MRAAAAARSALCREVGIACHDDSNDDAWAALERGRGAGQGVGWLAAAEHGQSQQPSSGGSVQMEMCDIKHGWTQQRAWRAHQTDPVQAQKATPPELRPPQRGTAQRGTAQQGTAACMSCSPNRPSADAKISTTRIFTNSVELAASDSAAEEPTMPTDRPHARLAQPGMVGQGRDGGTCAGRADWHGGRATGGGDSQYVTGCSRELPTLHERLASAPTQRYPPGRSQPTANKQLHAPVTEPAPRMA